MHARQGNTFEGNNTFYERRPAADTDSTRGILNGWQPPPPPPAEVPVAKVIVKTVILKSSG